MTKEEGKTKAKRKISAKERERLSKMTTWMTQEAKEHHKSTGKPWGDCMKWAGKQYKK
jgi:hypothetical protein